MNNLNITQSRYGISVRLLLKRSIFGLIFFLPFIAFLWFFLLLLGLTGLTLEISLAASSILLYGLFFIFEIIEIRAIYYEAKQSYFIIKNNVIDPRETVIDYSRMYDVEISKDPLDWLLGLRNVVISERFSEANLIRKAKIEGLSKIKSEGLKRFIEDAKEEWQKKPKSK
jgi:membrane protein YdbS with pleckstrin-like domain